jgi:putative copper resistance protein D
MLDWAIRVARIFQFGPALVLFGSPLFYLYGLRDATTYLSPRSFSFTSRWAWPLLLLLMAAVLALLGAVSWVLAETAEIFSDPGAFNLDAVWTVLTGTGFGRAAFWRIGLLVASIVALMMMRPGKTSWAVQTFIGSIVVMSFAWTGHGATDEGIEGLVHLGGDLLHLLSAGVWIGALLPLSILIMRSYRQGSEADARITSTALDAFSGVGPAVVAVLVLSGVINSWFLIGLQNVLQIFTTVYGWLLLSKLAVFAAMLWLAVENRFRLCPLLTSSLNNKSGRADALLALRRSVLLETGLALLVLCAVSWMGTLEPLRAGG